MCMCDGSYVCHVDRMEQEATETYSVAEIRRAFAQYATEDEWGVKSFYDLSLIRALRGEFDMRG